MRIKLVSCINPLLLSILNVFTSLGIDLLVDGNLMHIKSYSSCFDIDYGQDLIIIVNNVLAINFSDPRDEYTSMIIDILMVAL